MDADQRLGGVVFQTSGLRLHVQANREINTPIMKGISESDFRDVEASVRHFERVLELTKRLATRGIAVRGHEYAPHFFGMWKIVAGSFEHRYQFLWDARDQVLSVSEATFGSLGGQAENWRSCGELTFDARRGADPFKYVEEFTY